MVALKMGLFRAGQKQRLKSIQTETLRHSYQNTSLLLCPVTHSSTDLHAFTCLTSDSFLVSASTPLQLSLCYGPRAECPPWKARLTWAVLPLFPRYHPGNGSFPPAAVCSSKPDLCPKQICLQSILGPWNSPFMLKESLETLKGEAFGCPSPLPWGHGHPWLCRSQMS